MSLEEKGDWAIRCQRGALSQMRQILRLVLRTSITPEFEQARCTWTFNLTPSAGSSLIIPDSATGHKESYCLTAHLQRWLEELLRWFAPSWNEVDRDEQLPAFIWLKAGGREQLLRVLVTPPTAHERLEALLELRDWARGKVPDELLKTLRSDLGSDSSRRSAN